LAIGWHQVGWNPEGKKLMQSCRWCLSTKHHTEPHLFLGTIILCGPTTAGLIYFNPWQTYPASQHLNILQLVIQGFWGAHQLPLFLPIFGQLNCHPSYYLSRFCPFFAFLVV
jgi:hypothetical protein